MTNKLMLALVATPIALLAAPAAMAQDAPVNGVVTIFGDDKCPADAICVVAPESDRYRIPQVLRDQARAARQKESFAVRMDEVVTENAMGTGSCSTVGAGGQTGCFVKEATKAKREADARRDEARNLPLP